jgi:hypothetical protein
VARVNRRWHPSIATALGAAAGIALLGCHVARGYMKTDQPCHAGGGCQVGQACVDGVCALPEMYLYGFQDSGRTAGYVRSVSDDGGD